MPRCAHHLRAGRRHALNHAARGAIDPDVNPVFEAVSRYFSLLAEPMRLRILHAICSEAKSVSQIVSETGATQSNVSRHLNTLYAAGVLSRRKQGNFIFYVVSDITMTNICRMVCINVAALNEKSGRNGDSALALANHFEVPDSSMPVIRPLRVRRARARPR